MIHSLSIIPDFGYEAALIDHSDKKKVGWSLLKNYVINDSKYERLSNYI
jgi:hypothetical protein